MRASLRKIIYGFLTFVLLIIFYNDTLTTPMIEQEIDYISCSDLLGHYESPIPILLSDILILEQIERDLCHLQTGERVKVLVNQDYKLDDSLKDDPRFQVIYFENSTQNDYIEVEVRHKEKLLPKKFQTTSPAKNLNVPKNIGQFLSFLQRATFINCHGATQEKMKMANPSLSKNASNALALLRDELIALGMFPFLTGNTLLDWYQTCHVLENTMSLAVFSNEFNGKFLEKLENGFSSFKLVQKKGVLESSLKITVAFRTNPTISVVISLLYKTDDGLYLMKNKEKVKFSFYDPYCSTNMRGHLFWVSCNPEKRLKEEFGENWRKI